MIWVSPALCIWWLRPSFLQRRKSVKALIIQLTLPRSTDYSHKAPCLPESRNECDSAISGWKPCHPPWKATFFSSPLSLTFNRRVISKWRFKWFLHGQFEAENSDNPLRPSASPSQHGQIMQAQVPTFFFHGGSFVPLGFVRWHSWHLVLWLQRPSPFQPYSMGDAIPDKTSLTWLSSAIKLDQAYISPNGISFF